MMHFPVDLSTKEAIDTFVGALEAHIPYSLPILGYIFHSDGSEMNASPLAHFSTPKVQIWSSQSHLTAGTSRQTLFSIVLFSESDSQFRFFCSAEASGIPPTPEEQEHVRETLGSFMKSIVGNDPKYRSIVQPSSVDDANESFVFVGSVHEVWTSALHPYSPKINPRHVKYICPPNPQPNLQTSSFLEANGWTISQIQPSEVDLVKTVSGVSRSHDYLLGRCSSSVCIRDVKKSSAPVAWALIHADGSIGALYVQPDYRKRGLARLMVQELAWKSVPRSSEEGINIGRTGGTLGWNWTDVCESNDKSIWFMESLEGWKKGWNCYWLYLITSTSI